VDEIVHRLREFASRICTLRDDKRLENKAVLARAAADEIERLRGELESVGLQLRARMDAADELAATIRKLQIVQAERDEARREVCDMEGETAGGALLEARKRGWDCFHA
jgi:hypothetical protein